MDKLTQTSQSSILVLLWPMIVYLQTLLLSTAILEVLETHSLCKLQSHSPFSSIYQNNTFCLIYFHLIYVHDQAISDPIVLFVQTS